jgi:hypothetical protein
VNFGGAGSGIWWEEIGRTTLTVAGDIITVSSLPARKYLRILIPLNNSGFIESVLTFNGDTGSNYNHRYSVDGAAYITSASRANISIGPSGRSYPYNIVGEIVNYAGLEKIITFTTSFYNSAGAANLASFLSGMGKWANTSSQISSITVTNVSGGDFAIGSEIIVLGHN